MWHPLYLLSKFDQLIQLHSKQEVCFLPGDQVEHAHDNPVDEITLGESDMTASIVSDDLPSEKPVTPKTMNLEVDNEEEAKCDGGDDAGAEGKKPKKKENGKRKMPSSSWSAPMTNIKLGRAPLIGRSSSSEARENEDKNMEKREKKPKKKGKVKESEDTQRTNKTTKQERKSKWVFVNPRQQNYHYYSIKGG